MITFGTIPLPNGLRWSDEFDWSPVAQTVSFGLTGAAIIQYGVKQAGRPLTLTGGRSGLRSYAWLSRADGLALKAALDQAGVQRTLTLHDGRQFTVVPRTDNGSALAMFPVPIVDEIGPADPDGSWRYVVDEIRFLILAVL